MIRLAFALLLVVSLAVNVIMMTWSAGAFFIGKTFDLVTGTSSVISEMKHTNTRLAKSEAVLIKNKKLVSETSQKISRRTVRNATRNISATFAESIPYVGAGVVAGVTFLEIYDACKTMEDLASLNEQLGLEDTVDTKEVCGLKVPSSAEVIETVTSSPANAWNKMSEFDLKLPSWAKVKESNASLWEKTSNAGVSSFKWLFLD